jgi:hypothetical protein
VSAEPERPDVGAIVERVRGKLGMRIEPLDLALEWRDWRWMAVLPEIVILVAATEEGWTRLRREAALLTAARTMVGPQIASVLLEDPGSFVQIRESLSGLHGHEIEGRIFGIPAQPPMKAVPRFSPDCPLTRWGERFADDLGRTFARLHRAMTAAEGRAAGLLPNRTDWEKIERVLVELPGVEHLVRALPAARAWDEPRAVEEVVIHGDPHLYNMFASEDGRVSGLVDFGDAAVGDRHEDLRYVHSHGARFAEIAIEAYADEAGVAIDPEVVARYHVCSAFGHFAWWELMIAQGREQVIVEWTTAALEALAAEWVR